MRVKLVLALSQFPIDCSKAVPLFSSSLFVHLWFHMWLLFCPYLFLISGFGASGGLRLVIVRFPGYLHLYFSD